MSHEMFDNAFYFPSDKDEVQKIQKTGRIEIPQSREYGKGAVFFPTASEARTDAFSSGMVGGRNSPEAAFGRIARVRLRPEAPLILGDYNNHVNEYRMIASKLEESYESDEMQEKAHNVAETLGKRMNSPHSKLSPEHVAAFARAKALMTVDGRRNLVNAEMGNITQGNLGGASKVVDFLRLPYDALGSKETDQALAKKGNIVQLKDVKPLR